jgi:hypothetical protein
MKDFSRQELIARLRALSEIGSPRGLAQGRTATWRTVCREAAAMMELDHYAEIEHEHLGCHVEKTGIYASHPYCESCKGPAMSMGGCLAKDCPVKS